MSRRSGRTTDPDPNTAPSTYTTEIDQDWTKLFKNLKYGNQERTQKFVQGGFFFILSSKYSMVKNYIFWKSKLLVRENK